MTVDQSVAKISHSILREWVPTHKFDVSTFSYILHGLNLPDLVCVCLSQIKSAFTGVPTVLKTVTLYPPAPDGCLCLNVTVQRVRSPRQMTRQTLGAASDLLIARRIAP